ncbi:hypothetical protein BDF14DRAFT_1852639, partial [Spinellus fusiger]
MNEKRMIKKERKGKKNRVQNCQSISQSIIESSPTVQLNTLLDTKNREVQAFSIINTITVTVTVTVTTISLFLYTHYIPWVGWVSFGVLSHEYFLLVYTGSSCLLLHHGQMRCESVERQGQGVVKIVGFYCMCLKSIDRTITRSICCRVYSFSFLLFSFFAFFAFFLFLLLVI